MSTEHASGHKKGHFIKADDGKIYRLVGTDLDDVDPAVRQKVESRLAQPDAEDGAAVWIPTEGDDGIFIPHDDNRSFDKDKDTP